MIDPAHLLGTGGALGAVLRYGADRWIPHDRFPFSTALVNIVGSFVLALVVFADLHPPISLFVGSGACGAFTTYSSFSVQTVRLWETGDRLRAVIYAVGSLGTCMIAAGLAAMLVAFVGP